MFGSYRPMYVFTFWFLIGVMAMGTLQVARANGTGGIGGLLYLGEKQPLGRLVRAEIPNVPSAPDSFGHDGQFFYVIGLDLRAQWVPGYLEATGQSPGYRYRRIGYPALASWFGQLDGRALVWSMAAVSAMAVGIAAGTTALLAAHHGLTPWLALAVVLNPGVWLSGILLTSENLALALGLVAALAYVKGRSWLVVPSISLAALTKETSILFAIGLVGHALWRRDRASGFLIAIGAIIPLVLWTAYIHLFIGDPFASMDTLGPPFAGLGQAAGEWSRQPLLENVWIALIGAFLIVGAIGLMKAPVLWRWLAWPWILIAALSGRVVWEVGNNSIRALAPVIVLTVLGMGEVARGGNRRPGLQVRVYAASALSSKRRSPEASTTDQ